MGSYGNQGKSGTPRTDERFQVQGVRCSLGVIMDLSASGMKIRGEGKPLVAKGSVENFEVTTGRQKLSLPGQIVWIKKKGFRAKTHEIGVRFVDTRPQVREALEQLAKFGYIKSKKKSAKPELNSATLEAAVKVEDLYEILEVDRDASEEEIRRAYRALAKRYHPDVCDDEHASERFAVIGKAYRVLGDTETRRKYDELLRGSSAA